MATVDDLDHYEQVARAATQGPWDRASNGYVYAPDGITEGPVAEAHRPMRQEEDADHIATFDPPTVLELIATLRTQAAQIQAVREAKRALATNAMNGMTPEQALFQFGLDVQNALDTTGDTP